MTDLKKTDASTETGSNFPSVQLAKPGVPSVMGSTAEVIKRESLPNVSATYDPSTVNAKRSVFLLETHLGLKYAEVSSAYQKACRRGYLKEAMQWAVDMFLCGTKAARTNTWNRSKVIAVEDVGPADPFVIWLVYYCEKQTQDNIEAGLFWIAVAARLLAGAKKTRVNDWMMRMYDLRGKKIETPDELSKKLGESLEKKDMGLAWYYADALYQYEQKNVIKKFYEQKAFQGNAFVRDMKEIGLSANWYNDGKHRLLIAHIINCYCAGILPNKVMTHEEALAEIGKRGVDTKECQLMIELVRKRDRSQLVGMPDYALDKHTGRGKKMGRGLKHFIEEGAKLNNTDEYWEKISKQFLEAYFKE